MQSFEWMMVPHGDKAPPPRRVDAARMTIERIRRTIQREHKVTSTHVRSEHVTERLEDRVWYGTVEVFSSIDDPSVVAYGWVADAPDDRKDDDARRR